MEMTRFQSTIAAFGAVVDGHQDQAERREGGADAERELGAEAAAERARQRAGDEHHQRARQHQQAGAGGVAPKP